MYVKNVLSDNNDTEVELYRNLWTADEKEQIFCYDEPQL